MNRRRPGMGGPPEHLRVSADLKREMRELAERIRAGDYSADELDDLEGEFRELAEASDFSDRTPESPRDRELLTLLAASKKATLRKPAMAGRIHKSGRLNHETIRASSGCAGSNATVTD